MKFLFSVFFFIILVSFLSATIINIPADQPTIQEGINVAVDGDTVLVQPDTYVENINYIGKNITVASLFLTTQDTTFISQTIIDGDSIDSVVTFESGEDSTAVLCGFTITNGLGSGLPDSTGGGIYCEDSCPSLVNVMIMNNSSNNHGGGIFCCNFSSPSLKNSTITNNEADRGGGISCIQSNLSLENVTIENNSATSFGGGIVLYYSELVMFNCQLYNNLCGDGAELGRGGAMFIAVSTVSLSKCDFLNNSADSHAGAIYLSLASADIDKCSFVGNTSGGNVGGIYFYNSDHLDITNCTLYNNTGSDSGAMRFYIENAPNDIPIILNTICWNNSPTEILCSADGLTNELIVGYSDIEGGLDAIVTNNNANITWLEGNIDADPLFVDPVNGDYHLTENSPCIDAGDPTSPLDPDGTIADMGAYYYHQVNEIDDNEMQIVEFNLSNHPNPFNPETKIVFNLPEEGNVKLEIYNIKGQKVKTLVNEILPAGEHSAIWDGKDSNDKQVGSGIYFYKLKTGDYQKVRKMLLLK